MDRRFWILGTVIALSTGLPTFVSGQCGSASIQEGNTEIADCDGLGPTSTATTTKFYTMTSAVACQYVSQYGQQFGPTQTSVGAMGMCAHSNFGEPPNCVGVVGPALDQGGGLFHIRSQANFWNPSTLGCELDTPEDVPRQMYFEDCTGPVCCSQDHAAVCVHVNGGVFSDCRCYSTPIILSLTGPGLNLTNAMDGVIFDVLPDGIPERTAWTAPHSKDAFLVLDRNGDGFINNGKELFGAATDQPRSAERNGFLALKLFDANGDQQIDSMDPIYKILRLWTDSNHNGTSEANELQSLRSVGVIEIGLSYHTTSRRDRHGNVLRFVSSVKMRAKKGIVSRQIYDVLLIGGSNTLPLFQ